MIGDTIAAIATAMSASGIGIVRMSGKDAIQIIGKVYRSKNGRKDIRKVPSHTIHYGFIYDKEEIIDEVLVMIMKEPHSYTGEDTVEIDCHGGILAVRRVLETVIRYGARPAEPGEFTKRAFLGGRIDLSQAEAVIDVIQAKSTYALKSSMSQLNGSVMKSIKKIREELLYQLAYIESALDDPEHISLEGYDQILSNVIQEEKKRIRKLADSFSEGKLIREGIRTVILGKPNVGKSSLLNCLLGEEKAIVTEIAGTTRDVLEETILLQGISLRLMDTAGIRHTEDQVEKIGVERARRYAKEADLILYVADSSCSLDENDEEILKLLEEKRAIVLLNKSDLEQVLTKEELEEKTKKSVIAVSARTQQGMDLLEEKIKELFFHGELSFNDEVYITSIRHKNALEEAWKSLDMVEESIRMRMPEDFFSIDLVNACEALGMITGESVGEDLVQEIFSRFCVGK